MWCVRRFRRLTLRSATGSGAARRPYQKNGSPSPPLNIRRTLFFLIIATLFLCSAHSAETNGITLTQCFDEVLAHNNDLIRLRKDVERALSKGEYREADDRLLTLAAGLALAGGALLVALILVGR